MNYGIIKQLLMNECADFNETVLIESPFKEISRDSKQCLRFVRLDKGHFLCLKCEERNVYLFPALFKSVDPKDIIIISLVDPVGHYSLGDRYFYVTICLTSNAFVIVSKQNKQSLCGSSTIFTNDRANKIVEIVAFFPWNSVILSVFKKSKKQCLKASFINKTNRYFELDDIPKKKIFWELWCFHIKELHSTHKTWPFSNSSFLKDNIIKQEQVIEAQYFQTRLVKRVKVQQYRHAWTDKYLYLGSRREFEDKNRPVPIPGLGRTEEIQLLYLKPRYFGCWEQSEHWVQCGDSTPDMSRNTVKLKH